MDEKKAIDKENPTSSFSRRKLLKFITAFLGLFGLGAVFSSTIAFLTPPRSALKKVGGWQVVGNLSEFKEALSLSKVYFGLPILLMKEELGLRVFSAVCPHLGCIIQWDEKKKTFLCPCHDAIFDKSGKVVKGPLKDALLPFDLKVEGEMISVRLPEEKLHGYPSWFRITMISGV
jgi:Rieske Fe-S protein